MGACALRVGACDDSKTPPFMGAILLHPHHRSEDHRAAARALLDELLERGADVVLEGLGLAGSLLLFVLVLQQLLHHRQGRRLGLRLEQQRQIMESAFIQMEIAQSKLKQQQSALDGMLAQSSSK